MHAWLVPIRLVDLLEVSYFEAADIKVVAHFDDLEKNRTLIS